MLTIPDDWLTCKALISDCGLYRYTYIRDIPPRLFDKGKPKRTLLFLMHNPSTADDMKGDPTADRCFDFAKSLGFSRLIICNRYAYRSSDPNVLFEVDDPVGPLNDQILRTILEYVSDNDGLVIAGWGAFKARDPEQQKLLDDRGNFLSELAHYYGVPLHALHITKEGHPGHPLYLPSDAKPEYWPGYHQ